MTAQMWPLFQFLAGVGAGFGVAVLMGVVREAGHTTRLQMTEDEAIRRYIKRRVRDAVSGLERGQAKKDLDDAVARLVYRSERRGAADEIPPDYDHITPREGGA